MALIQGNALQYDPAGAGVEAIGPDDVESLQKLLAASGLPEVSLEARYSVIFIYPGIGAGDRHPELAGCTAELCTFADETTEFIKHGIQLAGISTQPTAPMGDFLGTFPFPVGQLPTNSAGPLIELVTKDEDTYATRRSFVVFPDRTGIKITNIKDTVGHVRKCFHTAIERRLAQYREAAISFFQQEGSSVRLGMTHTGFLANGADSVSISTVDFQTRLVAKMASPDIVEQEGGYMQRINRLLREHHKPSLFPAVLAIRIDERPAYYLMEAANPRSLDHLVFEDDAMTRLRRDRLHLLSQALQKLANLYEISFRAEEPAVARYHYLDRFSAITQRNDFKETHEFMFAGTSSLDELLAAPVVIDGDFVCRPFNEQLHVLDAHIDTLAQPVGAYLHGDVHLKNMLVDDEGRGVVYVDPRIVWDGNDVGDPGFGDPLYDFGTLLHSLHVMSAILIAVESNETEALMSVEEDTVDDKPGLVTWPGVLRITGSDTIAWFTEWMERSVAREVLGPHWTARLHVNTANALLGWLKYARAVRTRQAWLAIFASALYHLELAARELEGLETEEVAS
jgi:hypothetical protein